MQSAKTTRPCTHARRWYAILFIVVCGLLPQSAPAFDFTQIKHWYNANQERVDTAGGIFFLGVAATILGGMLWHLWTRPINMPTLWSDDYTPREDSSTNAQDKASQNYVMHYLNVAQQKTTEKSGNECAYYAVHFAKTLSDALRNKRNPNEVQTKLLAFTKLEAWKTTIKNAKLDAELLDAASIAKVAHECAKLPADSFSIIENVETLNQFALLALTAKNLHTAFERLKKRGGMHIFLISNAKEEHDEAAQKMRARAGHWIAVVAQRQGNTIACYVMDSMLDSALDQSNNPLDKEGVQSLSLPDGNIEFENRKRRSMRMTRCLIDNILENTELPTLLEHFMKYDNNFATAQNIFDKKNADYIANTLAQLDKIATQADEAHHAQNLVFQYTYGNEMRKLLACIQEAMQHDPQLSKELETYNKLAKYFEEVPQALP